MATLTSRFDLHEITRNAINLAVSLKVVDAVEIAVMASQHGDDDAAWLSDLCETAFIARHHDKNDSHAAMCRLNDKWHAAKAKATTNGEPK